MNALLICFQPRKAIRTIVENKSPIPLLFLAVIAGLAHVMQISPHLLKDGVSSRNVLLAVLIGGAVLGIMMLSFGVPGLAMKIHRLRTAFPHWTAMYAVGPEDPYVAELIRQEGGQPPPAKKKPPDFLPGIQEKLDALKESREIAYLKLQSGRIYEGIILEMDEANIYIETQNGVQTIAKAHVTAIGQEE